MQNKTMETIRAEKRFAADQNNRSSNFEESDYMKQTERTTENKNERERERERFWISKSQQTEGNMGTENPHVGCPFFKFSDLSNLSNSLIIDFHLFIQLFLASPTCPKFKILSLLSHYPIKN